MYLDLQGNNLHLMSETASYTHTSKTEAIDLREDSQNQLSVQLPEPVV